MIDDSIKVQIIRSAIAHPGGWINLAQSVISGEEGFAKKECHRMFEIIANDSYNPEIWYDILVHELDKHIEEVKASQRNRLGGLNSKQKIG